MVRIRGVASIVVAAPRERVEDALTKRRTAGARYAVQEAPGGLRVVFADERSPSTFLEEISWRLRPEERQDALRRELAELKVELEQR